MHPAILTYAQRGMVAASAACLAMADELRADGREDLALIMDRNAAEVIAPMCKLEGHTRWNYC